MSTAPLPPPPAKPGWTRQGKLVVAGGVIVMLVLVVIASALEPPDQASESAASSSPATVPPTTTSTPPPAEPSFLMPDVQGLTADEAARRLRQASSGTGVKHVDIEVTISFEKGAEGLIEESSVEAGDSVTEGSPISMQVTLPPMPDLSRDRAAPAVRDLRGLGYKVRTVLRATSAQPPGTVIRQIPKAGGEPVPGEDTIVLTVAKAEPEPPGSDCTSGYEPCLPLASDYDCAGGSGDGPKYTGVVRVTGTDPYGLDSDGDGYGCE